LAIAKPIPLLAPVIKTFGLLNCRILLVIPKIADFLILVEFEIKA